MIPVTNPGTQPVACKEQLDRNGAQAGALGGSAELWAEIHSGVERLLGPLEEEVRREVAGVRIVAGRTQGTSFFFSYRTFSLPECAVDPVVVGMTFTPTVGGVRVDADASGESIGDVLLSVPSEIVAATGEEMLAAAARAVGLLGHAAGFIAAALANPTRRVS